MARKAWLESSPLVIDNYGVVSDEVIGVVKYCAVARLLYCNGRRTSTSHSVVHRRVRLQHMQRGLCCRGGYWNTTKCVCTHNVTHTQGLSVGGLQTAQIWPNTGVGSVFDCKYYIFGLTYK